jgi:hypothetical protein
LLSPAWLAVIVQLPALAMWTVEPEIGQFSECAEREAAEFVMQERDGVLYVKNVEPPVRATRAKPGAGPVPYPRFVRSSARPRSARAGAGPGGVRNPRGVELRADGGVAAEAAWADAALLYARDGARLGLQNVFNVRGNVEAGIRHLRDLVDLYRGNLAFALPPTTPAPMPSPATVASRRTRKPAPMWRASFGSSRHARRSG